MRYPARHRISRSLCRKVTAAGLSALLLVAGMPSPAAAQSCQGWNTAKFFETATADEVRACLSAGEDPNKPDTQALTALHRAARDTSDPAVIEALLDAGANPRVYSIAGRLPWDFARKNKQIKGSAAYQRLLIMLAKMADWSRVQAVARDTKTVVHQYRDAVPQGSWKIKGRFESATANSMTVRHKDGQTHSIPKSSVQKVRIPRPFKKRWPGWTTLAITMLAAQAIPRLTSRIGGSSEEQSRQITGLYIWLVAPATVVAFLNSRMGPIYNVPPKHRMLLQGDQQTGKQNNDSGKQQEPGSPTG